ncbi:MAG: serine hydrolase [Thermaerobacterales bacterium]
MPEKVFPGKEWSYVNPAEAGLEPEKLEQARRYFDYNVGGPYRAVIVRHGRVVAEWNQEYESDVRLYIFSAIKSFLSCLLGIAVHEGKISSADDQVTDYYPEALDVPAGTGPKPGRHVFPENRDITLRQLISQTSGYMKPGEKPGQVYHYQSFGMNILGKAIARAYGLFDEPGPEVTPNLKKLYDEKFRIPLEASWGYYMKPVIPASDPKSIPAKYRTYNTVVQPGAWAEIFCYSDGIRMSALDMARMGWLWCNWGSWNGRQLIPETWMREAARTAPDIRANHPEHERMYGYAFWINEFGVLWPDAPRDSFAARGATDRAHIWACPSLDLVVAESPGLAPDERNEFLRLLVAACASEDA